MDVPVAGRGGRALLWCATRVFAAVLLIAACGGGDDEGGASATEGGEEAPRLGSARRPDPSPWVPAPEGEGAPAPTGEVAALAPSGPHAAVRAAYIDFVRRLLAGDWDGLTETLAPQVGVAGRPQTLDRAEVIRRIRQRVDRMQLQGARVGDVLEPREISVQPADAEASRANGLQQGDLVVRATPRIPSARSPFGGWQESPQLLLVFRREEGRWVVVAAEY